MGLVFPEEHGGQGLPWTLNTAVAEIFAAADLELSADVLAAIDRVSADIMYPMG